MNDLESVIRRVIREELQAVLEELLPRFLSQPSKEPKAPEEELLLSTREAAKRLSISERTLFALTKSGQLPCVRLGMAKRYSVESIKNWVQKAEAEPGSQSVSRPHKTGSASETHISAKPKPVKRSRLKKNQIPPESRSNARLPAITKSAVQRKQDDQEQHPNPLDLLMDEIGVDRDEVSTVTFGELRQIAGVGMPTYHGWRFLGRPMPKEAIEKLRGYLRQFAKSE